MGWIGDLTATASDLYKFELSQKYDTELARSDAENDLLKSLWYQQETQQSAAPGVTAGQANQQTNYQQIAIYGGLGLVAVIGVALLVGVRK